MEKGGGFKIFNKITFSLEGSYFKGVFQLTSKVC